MPADLVNYDHAVSIVSQHNLLLVYHCFESINNRYYVCSLKMFYLLQLKQRSWPYIVETGALHFDTDANLCALLYTPAIAQQNSNSYR